jgi:hypothetical protein
MSLKSPFNREHEKDGRNIPAGKDVALREDMQRMDIVVFHVWGTVDYVWNCWNHMECRDASGQEITAREFFKK